MDNDDSMLSEPSSQGDELYDDDNLFPDSNTDLARPQTPQNDHLNAAAPGELSPPRSQSINMNESAAIRTRYPRMDDTEDLSPTAANRTLMPNDEEWKPGRGWKSKKAQEEMQRAWDNVVDKEFSLKEFGDVMALRLTK